MSSPRYRVMVSEGPASVPKQYCSRTYTTFEAAAAARECAAADALEETVAWIEVEQTQWVIAHA